MAGMEDVVIAGGTEMMSSYKENASKARLPFMDRGNLHLRDLHPQTNQGVAADAIATLEGISRTALYQLAVDAQRRAALAIEEGRFHKQPVPALTEDGRVAPVPAEIPHTAPTHDATPRLTPPV